MGKVPLLFVLVCLLLSSCAIEPGSVPSYLKRWDRICYRGMDEDLFRISAIAKDCGVIGLSETRYNRGLVVSCVEAAKKDGIVFRVGYEGMGDDSRYCVAYVGPVKGSFVSLFYDDDTLGKVFSNRDLSGISASRCEEVRMVDGEPSGSQCAIDEALLKSILVGR